MKSKRSKLSKVLTSISLIVFIYASYQLVTMGKEYYYNRQVLSEVQDVYRSSYSEVDTNQFTALQEINQDIIGWLSIDDTQIDYPILQAQDNSFYLTRNYKKEYAPAGSIFMDYRNNKDNNNLNTIIYGHEMKDGSMFRDLYKFKDESFLRENPTFYYDTPNESYEAEVFSVYRTTTDFNYIQTDFNSSESYGDLLKSIQNKSLYKTATSINKDEEIITLSVCDYDIDPVEGRFVVHAKLNKR